MPSSTLKETQAHTGIIYPDQQAAQSRNAIAEHVKQATGEKNPNVVPNTEQQLKLEQAQANEENKIVLNEGLYEDVFNLDLHHSEKNSEIGEAGANLIVLPDNIEPQKKDTVVSVVKDFWQQIWRSLQRKPGPYYLPSEELKELKEENARLRGQEIPEPKTEKPTPKAEAVPQETTEITPVAQDEAAVAPTESVTPVNAENTPTVQNTQPTATEHDQQNLTQPEPSVSSQPVTEVPPAIQQAFDNEPLAATDPTQPSVPEAFTNAFPEDEAVAPLTPTNTQNEPIAIPAQNTAS